MEKSIKFLLKNKNTIFLLLLFCLHLFFRFYKLEYRAQIGWDQLDNAWAAKDILVDHKLPLLGMVGKLNSGIYIGSLYYYFIAVFYFFTRLDPIASPIIAGVTSIFSFFVLYFISKKIFDEKVALVAVFLHTVSNFIIEQDRIQWPVNFIAPLSFLIFYCLWKVANGKSSYILFCAILIGLFFHIHLTAIFFLLIVLLSMPLFPRNSTTLKYILISIPVFLLFFIPHFIYYSHLKSSLTGSVYFSSSYHGLHLRRVLQLAHDAFIEFEAILSLRFLRQTVFFYFPLFLFFYARSNSFKKTLRISYLMTLWIFVPWLVLSTYRGELSNYYFSLSRFIALVILAYIIVYLWQSKIFLLKLALLLFLGYYTFFNVNKFFQASRGNLIENREKVNKAIESGVKLGFVQGDPISYLYYIYTRKK